MPRPPRPLPPELGDTFTTARALAAGLTQRRTRAGDLENPFHGVRQRIVAERAPDDAPFARDRAQGARVLRRALAYREVMPAHAFFVGRTALALLDQPVDHGEDLEVAVLSPARAPRARGVRGRRIDPAYVEVGAIGALPATSPATAWAMLGRDVGLRDLVVIGDSLVRVPRDSNGRRLPDRAITTLDALARAAAVPHLRGGAHVREALGLVRVGSASPLETDYRLAAHAAGLPEPELDVEIRDETGRLLGISDAGYRTYGVVVEVEGDHHRTDPRQWDRDIEKYAAYTALGLDVVRLTGRHACGQDGVGRVHAALARRGWRG